MLISVSMCAATSGTAFSAADDTCSVFWRFSLDMDEEQEYVIMKGANERQLVFCHQPARKGIGAILLFQDGTLKLEERVGFAETLKLPCFQEGLLSDRVTSEKGQHFTGFD